MKPGLYQIAAEEYHADPCPEPSLSSSLAKLMLGQSPLHAWTASPRLNPAWEPKESRVFNIGRAAHRAVLGAGGDYVAYPDDVLASNGAASTKAAKEWAEDQKSRGLTVLRSDELEQVESMAARARLRLAQMGISFAPARSEMVAIAQIDGVWCRAMIDNAPADPRAPLYDFKTCEDASPDAVIRSITSYGYDVQAAHYLDVWRAATGEKRKFRFVFQEKSAPHELSVVELHDDPDSESDWMLDARSKAAEARRMWAHCLKSGEWPGYPPMVGIVGAPSYYRAKWAERSVGATSPSPETIAAATAWQSPE